jgi:hypothetical protein
MRQRKEIEHRIDLELYRVYTGINEVTTNDCWERARALAWVLNVEMRQDRWLRDRYTEVVSRLKADAEVVANEMEEK